MNSKQVLVVGLGCQRGCPASVLRTLLDETLLAHGIALEALRALASIDLKHDEPGLLELAGQLALPLTFFSADQLSGYRERLSHRSQIAFERTGCYGIAESAALALAEQLGKNDRHLADSPPEVRPGHTGIGGRVVKPDNLAPWIMSDLHSNIALPPYFRNRS